MKPTEEQEADVTASVSLVLIQTGLFLCHAINGIQKIQKKQLCSAVLIQLKSFFPKESVVFWPDHATQSLIAKILLHFLIHQTENVSALVALPRFHLLKKGNCVS